MRKIIASLDLGTSYIKLVVGEIFKNKLNVLAVTEVSSRGIKGGFIVNAESATDAIKEAFDKCSEKLGYKIDKVVINIPSYGVSTFMTTDQMNIKNNIITKEATIKLLNHSVKDKVSSSFELIDITPTYYVINDSEKVIDPVGINAEKLAVKAVGNAVPKKNMNLIIKCLDSIGVKVIDKMINPISDFYEFVDPSMKNTNGAIINIGAAKTEVSIFNKGILVGSDLLSMGGLTIDQALAYNYKISKSDAIYLKEKLVVLDKTIAKASESISFNTKNGDVIKVNQYDSSQIAIEKLIEMLNLIKKQINLLTKKEISYIIVTGGITELSEFEFLLDEMFNRKAKIGKVLEIGIRDNKYSSVAGLIKYYNKKLKDYEIDFSVISLEDEENFSGIHRKVNVSGSPILGKLIGMFYDN